MDDVTPMLVTNHYRNNKDVYEEIEQRLEETRKMFFTANRQTQIRMLQQSHSFGVISVQTPVHIHEQAFAQLWENNTPLEDIDDALSSVNYLNQKTEYITHSIENPEMWGDVVDMLENRNIDGAHKYILDEMKGVGPAKAPFTLAMLGFTEKACIDANVIDAMGLEKHVSTVVVEKYDAIVESLREKMPTLKEITSPFMWQWAVFDWNRDEISEHKIFYQVIGTL